MSGSEQVNFAQQLPRAEAIAQLNDRLRQRGNGGQIVITRGVANLPHFDSDALLKALAAYDAFDEDNDPHGERDFGDISVFGTDLLWKIDYYDQELMYASPDPADPSVTVRVLTVMLEMEY
jgi:hypothetical protein